MSSSTSIYALQYADDAEFPSLTDDELQSYPDVISETYLRVGLIVNTTKSNVLSAWSSDAHTYSISGKLFNNSENFIYFGSNLSFSGDLTYEIQRRINLASPAFGRQRERVFTNRNLTIHIEITVYDTIVIFTILYSWQSWVPFRHHIWLLESFHARCLQLFHGFH